MTLSQGTKEDIYEYVCAHKGANIESIAEAFNIDFWLVADLTDELLEEGLLDMEN